MRKFRKKFMSLAMIGALLCTPITAYADDNTTEADDLADTGELSGTGSLEGAVDKEVVKVVLPTSTASSATLSFILDPQQLIAGSEGASLSGKTFDPDATVYFANTAEDSEYNYSATSDPVTIINKSSVPVDVYLSAEVDSSTLTATAGGTLALVSDTADFDTSDGTTTTVPNQVCLTASLNGGNSKAVTAATVALSDSTNPVKLEAAPDGAYSVKYDTTNQAYSYVLDENLSNDEFDSCSFTLSGEANPNTAADWTTVSDVAPEVKFTWTLAKGTATPSTNVAITASDTTAATITVAPGNGRYAFAANTNPITAIKIGSYDVLNANGSKWTASTFSGVTDFTTYDGTSTFTITLPSGYSTYTAQTVADVEITYQLANGKTATTTVKNVSLK